MSNLIIYATKNTKLKVSADSINVNLFMSF